MILGIYLIVVLLMLAMVLAAGAFAVFLSTCAVRFSRVTLGLAIGVILMQSSVRLADQNFLNFVAWAIIGIGGIFLLSTLPRLDRALRFVSNLVISYLVSGILLGLVVSIISAIAGKEFEIKWWLEILQKLCCLGFSVLMMLSEGKKKPFEYSNNPIVAILERAAASVLYGFSLILVLPSMSSNWNTPLVLEWILFAVFVVGTYIGDIYLQKHPLAILEEEKPVQMPR